MQVIIYNYSLLYVFPYFLAHEDNENTIKIKLLIGTVSKYLDGISRVNKTTS